MGMGAHAALRKAREESNFSKGRERERGGRGGNMTITPFTSSSLEVDSYPGKSFRGKITRKEEEAGH